MTIALQAEGVSVVRGEVTLVNARGERRTRTLERGATTFRATWIRAGERTFTVIYEGSGKVAPRTVTRTVTIA